MKTQTRQHYWWPPLLMLTAQLWACEASLEVADLDAPPAPNDPIGMQMPDDPNTPKQPEEPEQPPGPQTPEEPDDPNRLDGAELFSCSADKVASTPSRIKRIKPNHFARKWGRDAPPAPYSISAELRYSSYTHQDLIDESSAEQVLNLALTRAKIIVGKQLNDYPKCFWQQEKPDRTCLESFTSSFVKRNLFEAVTQEELEDYISFGLAQMDKLGPVEGKELMLAAIFASPRSYYRQELGGGQPDEHGRLMLSPEELGHAISYAIVDSTFSEERSMPLRGITGRMSAAVADGTIQDKATLEAFVKELLEVKDEDGAPLVHNNIERFFVEYLQYDRPQDVFKSGGPKLSYAPENYQQQAQAMVDRILRQDQDVLKRLLTTREMNLFTDQNGKISERNEVYNYDASVTQNPVTLPANERAGILTHPAWLAAQSRNNYDEAHAIYRGYWIRKNLLCGSVPAIPITVAALLPEHTDKTVRERLAMATEPVNEQDTERGYCWGCHQLMNPLGVPFEIYDHRGQYRTKEQLFRPDAEGKLVEFYADVDASYELRLTGDPRLDGVTVKDATELMALLSESQVVEQCFVRHTFRYFAGRPETAQDSCTLANMYDAYQQSGGSFNAMLTSLLTSDSFLYRTPEVTP